MKRLTMYVENKTFYSDNGNPMIPAELLDTPIVREVLKRLAEYEDLGLTPDVIQYKLDENEQLKADIRGKDNEIAVLKWRVKYLEQFKQVEVDNHVCCGEPPF